MILELIDLACKVENAARERGLVDASRFVSFHLLTQAEIGAVLREQKDALPPAVFESRSTALKTPAMYDWRNLSPAAQELIADLARQNGAAEALSAIVGPLPAAAGAADGGSKPEPLPAASGPSDSGYSTLAGREMAAVDDGRTVPRRSELFG